MNSPDTAQSAMRIWTQWTEAPVLRFDTLVLAFCTGIALYFGAPSEVSAWVWGTPVIVMTVTLWVMRRSTHDSWVWGALFLAMTVGGGYAALNTAANDTPRLSPVERSYEISGWVESIAASGKGVRWHIVVEDMSRLSADKRPAKVRVRLGQKHKDAAIAGDSVRLTANLASPPGPAVPNGYNPAKRAYFEGIGGFGYAMSVPEVLPMPERVSLKRHIAHWRYSLAKHIYETAPAETAGLQAALLTGVRRYIPSEQTDALRAAGLAHILAISGLHMGLLAGTAYFVFTYLLVHIAPLSRRYDVRKFAAGLGIVAASIYLVLSGASVATQRAYIMAVIVFLAVILDRQAISVRSVSVAALITLLLNPEALTSVGFQMSFAAVLALVVVYRTWQDHRPIRARGGLLSRIRNNAVSLSVTSLVAGAATAGFALFHFGRIARYGLAGNLLAMPIFTFAIMPLGIIALVLLPFGLEGLPLWAMGKSIEPLIAVSTWISGWDGALARVRGAPSWIIGAYGLAFVLLLIGEWRGRVIGAGLIMACVVGWRMEPVPDMRISEDGRVAFWETQEFQKLIVTSERADRFGREQFSEKAGQGDVEAVAFQKSDFPCDALACRFEVKGRSIAVLNHPSEAPIECAENDLVVLTVREVGPEVRRYCDAILIDGRTLRQEGALDVYLSSEIWWQGTKKPPENRRPWD